MLDVFQGVGGGARGGGGVGEGRKVLYISENFNMVVGHFLFLKQNEG